jgi:hypothetical protein
MPEKRMTEARKVGDTFYKNNFGKGIKSRANLILKISVILIALELIDEIPIIIDVFNEDPALIIFSIVEILVPVILLVVIFLLVKEVEKWEDTYNKVKKLLG